MPWHIDEDREGCDGFAVIKDADDSLAGCHDTREQAEDQMTALYANEPRMETEAMQPGELPVDPQVTQDEFAVLDQTDTMSDTDYAAAFPLPTPGAGTTPVHGVACVEGIEDGADPPRTWLPGSLVFAPLPYPLKWQPAEDEAHRGAVVVGRVDAIWRDGAFIRWAGVLDNGSDAGREIERQIQGSFIRGVSIKADDVRETEVETLMGPMLVVGEDDEMGEDYTDDGEDFHLPGKHNQKDHGYGKGGSKTRVSSRQREAAVKRLRSRGYDLAALDTVVAHGADFGYDPDAVACLYHHGRIRSLTIVAEPAYVEATVSIGESPFEPISVEPAPSPLAEVEEMADEPVMDAPIVAASYTITIPDVWPESWFEEPTDEEMRGLTAGAVNILPNGRVYGLLAPANVDHRAFRASGQRITVPRGIDYSEWQNKACIVAGADGGAYKIAAGTVTFGCGHADPNDPRRANPAWAAEHYDNSCSVAMRARAGENKYGTWFAGALAHGLTASSFQQIMGCALSGDWQGGKLKAALLVPCEGFPTAVTASVRERMGTLVASSVPIRYVPPAPEPDIWALVAAATGRGPDAFFDDLADQRFSELSEGR